MPQSSKLCCLPGCKLPRHLNPSGECLKFCGNSHKSQAQRQGEIILKTYNQPAVYNSIVIDILVDEKFQCFTQK